MKRFSLTGSCVLHCAKQVFRVLRSAQHMCVGRLESVSYHKGHGIYMRTFPLQRIRITGLFSFVDLMGVLTFPPLRAQDRAPCIMMQSHPTSNKAVFLTYDVDRLVNIKPKLGSKRSSWLPSIVACRRDLLYGRG
jgi:hypothetical protein